MEHPFFHPLLRGGGGGENTTTEASGSGEVLTSGQGEKKWMCIIFIKKGVGGRMWICSSCIIVLTGKIFKYINKYIWFSQVWSHR